MNNVKIQNIDFFVISLTQIWINPFLLQIISTLLSGATEDS